MPLERELILDQLGDESRPRCRQCTRREEVCQYESPIRFKHQVTSSSPARRKAPSQPAGANNATRSSSSGLDTSSTISSLPPDNNDVSRGPMSLEGGATPLPVPWVVISNRLQPESPAVHAASPQTWSSSLLAGHESAYLDAIYLHHFASELGRWLDCTDPTRQFTLKIPRLVHEERILLLAVTCFAARHMKHRTKAALAHEESVKLLISRLDEANAATDDALLCCIVILRVYEQLDGVLEYPQICRD